MSKIITDSEFGDLGLEDDIRAVSAQLNPAAAGRPPLPSTTNLVSTEVEQLPQIGGCIVHTVHRTNQGPKDVKQIAPDEPDIIPTVDLSHLTPRNQAPVTSFAPGRNPDFVGRPVDHKPDVTVVNGQLVAVGSGIPSPQADYPENITSGLKPQPKPSQSPAVASAVGEPTPVSPVEVVKGKKGTLSEAVEVKDVMILRPTLRDVHALVHHATLSLFNRNTYGYDAQVGDAVISHSRNLLADRFMKSGFTWALWWDDDIVPPTGNVNWMRANIAGMPPAYPAQFLQINPIQRMKSHGKTLVGGLYFGRKHPYVAICERTTDTAGTFGNVPRQQLLPVGWVGTGFMLVHRSVFEAMQAKFPELAPKSGAVNAYERVWDYFRPDRDQAEDVSFCKRANECGHQPYVDLSVVAFHVGDYAFGPWNQK